MTTAEKIINTASNASEADAAAQNLATSATQDWENEATIYAFDDDSVLVISGSQLSAFDDLEAAQKSLDA